MAIEQSAVTAQAPPGATPAAWRQRFEALNHTLWAASEPGFLARLLEDAAALRQLVLAQPDLALFQVLRQEAVDDLPYGPTHSVHTAVSVLLVARRMGWTDAAQHSSFMAALSMNLAMLPLQSDLVRHGSPLTVAAMETIHEHPVQGATMLRAAGVNDADWLRAVAEHHEVADGSGYPGGTSSPSDAATLLRLADNYCAKLSRRVGRAAIVADRAGRTLYEMDADHPITVALIAEFGIYPPGCFVRLFSGEIGMVVRRGPTVITPVVAVLSDPQGQPLAQPLERDTSRRPHAVASALQSLPAALQRAPQALMQLAC